MHRAFVGDFEQLRSLGLVENPYELDRPFDLIEHADLGLAIPAVFRVDFRVSQANRHGFERPLLARGLSLLRVESRFAAQAEKWAAAKHPRYEHVLQRGREGLHRLSESLSSSRRFRV